MSEHLICVEWARKSEDFSYEKFSRDHVWHYGNETKICASSSPDFFGNPQCLNPEQGFAASLSSCHMLTFLALCSRRNYVVDSYSDEAVAVLGKNNIGKIAIIKVELRPVVGFAPGKAPTREQFTTLHDRAHDNCFIANSYASCVEVGISPTMKST